jgi:hypothetical protein
MTAAPEQVVTVPGLVVYREMAQRSEEWYEARRGMVTASMVGALISVGPPDALAVGCSSCGSAADEPCISTARKTPTPIKVPHAERTAAASNLPPVYTPADNDTSRSIVTLLAAERVSGYVEDTWPTRDMWRGIEAEPYARDAYSEHYAPVIECGFMVRDLGGYVLGYSPDGLVGDDGLIEIKSPRAKGHVGTVVSGEVPAQYMAQLQCGLLVSGREWIDYVSYSGGLHLWRKRVTPDQRWFDAIKAAVAHTEKAITELVATYEQATEGLPLTERIFTEEDMRV